jgi:hypothetical protein
MSRNGAPSDTSPLDRGLPQALDAERFLLGSIILDGERFTEVAAI